MQDLTVALVQVDQHWEDKQANWNHYRSIIQKISSPVDLIVLPEMFDTGFSMRTDLAEDWNNNSSLQFILWCAKQSESAIYTSVMCRENEAYYNRGVFAYPDGRFELYDKRKTFGLAGEDRVYTSGNYEKIVSYKGWNIQLQICYDLRFPELCRNRITNEGQPAYDLLLYVANWPTSRALHWTTLLQARAIENQCYTIGVNRIGTDGKELFYSGDSVCVHPLGEIQSCQSGSEELKIVCISRELLNDVRLKLPFLKDR
jgi:omega-amidase